MGARVERLTDRTLICDLNTTEVGREPKDLDIRPKQSTLIRIFNKGVFGRFRTIFRVTFTAD